MFGLYLKRHSIIKLNISTEFYNKSKWYFVDNTEDCKQQYIGNVFLLTVTLNKSLSLKYEWPTNQTGFTVSYRTQFSGEKVGIEFSLILW